MEGTYPPMSSAVQKSEPKLAPLFVRARPPVKAWTQSPAVVSVQHPQVRGAG